MKYESELWNPHIPEMIGGYAGDLATVMAQLSTGLRPRGRVYMVVGDSRYAGVDISVAMILHEISVPMGYKLVRLEPFRSMRSSPQQGGRRELEETLLVFEKH